MATSVTNSVDYGNIALRNEEYRDDLLTFTGVATVLQGTLLARRAVALAITPSACTGTGTGTITLATVVPGAVVPLVGSYKLTCTAAVSNGGVFRLDDPNGQEVMTGITMTPGAGGTTVVKAGGMQFTITDATDFVAGDFFTLPIVADGKLVPYDPAGAGGVQIPKCVLAADVTSTGAGDVVVRPIISGYVNKTRLIINADGTGANITKAIEEQLRAVSIIPVQVDQLSS